MYNILYTEGPLREVPLYTQSVEEHVEASYTVNKSNAV